MDKYKFIKIIDKAFAITMCWLTIGIFITTGFAINYIITGYAIPYTITLFTVVFVLPIITVILIAAMGAYIHITFYGG